MISDRMTKEQLVALANDISSMSQEFIDSRDVKSLRNMTYNLANMMKIHMVDLTDRELKLIVYAMSGSQVQMNLQKEVFELVQKLRLALGETT